MSEKVTLAVVEALKEIALASLNAKSTVSTKLCPSVLKEELAKIIPDGESAIDLATKIGQGWYDYDPGGVNTDPPATDEPDYVLYDSSAKKEEVKTLRGKNAESLANELIAAKKVGDPISKDDYDRLPARWQKIVDDTQKEEEVSAPDQPPAFPLFNQHGEETDIVDSDAWIGLFEQALSACSDKDEYDALVSANQDTVEALPNEQKKAAEDLIEGYNPDCVDEGEPATELDADDENTLEDVVESESDVEEVTEDDMKDLMRDATSKIGVPAIQKLFTKHSENGRAKFNDIPVKNWPALKAEVEQAIAAKKAG